MKTYIDQTHPNRGTIKIENSIYEFCTNSHVLPGVSSSRKQIWTCQKLKNRIHMAIEFESLKDLIENLKSTFHNENTDHTTN